MQVQSLTGVPGSLVGGVFSVGQELPVLVIVRRMLQDLTHTWWPTQHGGLFGKAAQYAASSGLGSKAGSLLDAASRNPFRLAVPSSQFRGSASAVDQGRLGMPSRAAGHQGRAQGLSPNLSRRWLYSG